MCFSLNVSLKMSGGFYVSESKDTKQTDRSAASLCVQLVRVGKTEQLKNICSCIFSWLELQRLVTFAKLNAKYFDNQVIVCNFCHICWFHVQILFRFVAYL